MARDGNLQITLVAIRKSVQWDRVSRMSWPRACTQQPDGVPLTRWQPAWNWEWDAKMAGTCETLPLCGRMEVALS